jgi:hypothetical protein
MSVLVYCNIFVIKKLCAFVISNCIVKEESSPSTGLDRPSGFQEVEAPTFQYNRLMKVERLSTLCTGRLYRPGNIPGTHFC